MSVNEQVKEFHEVFGQPIKDHPEAPDEARVRLRARLIAEEFLETMTALFDLQVEWQGLDSIVQIGERLRHIIRLAPVKVDIVELADSLADLDYVVEGTRLEFGIDGGPVADEVHRSNMAKATECSQCEGVGTLNDDRVRGPWPPCPGCKGQGCIVRLREDGKILKPETWAAPDIARVLRKQGWRG